MAIKYMATLTVQRLQQLQTSNSTAGSSGPAAEQPAGTKIKVAVV